MRKTLATLAVAALALAGCGTTGEDEATVSNTPAPSSSEAQSSGPTELKIGEAAHLTTDGENPRDIDVTVTDIQVFEQCPEGELESLPKDRNGGVYVFVKWDTDVRETVNDYVATKWVGVGEGDTVLETETAGECRQPEGVMFPEYVLPGTNASAGQVFWVADKPAKWFLNESWEPHAFAWPVPDEVSSAPEKSEGEASETAAPEAAPVEQAPAADTAPTVVGCRNHGGTALMSDGSEAYSASCDENANGLVPGNTGNAYDPPVTADNNYNPDTARIAGQNWWGECIAANTAEYCRANDPYQ